MSRSSLTASRTVLSRYTPGSSQSAQREWSRRTPIWSNRRSQQSGFASYSTCRGFGPGCAMPSRRKTCGSVREYDRQIKHAETQALRVLVDAAEARTRKNGERPPKGSSIKDAACDEVAEQQDPPTTGDALKKRFQRDK